MKLDPNMAAVESCYMKEIGADKKQVKEQIEKISEAREETLKNCNLTQETKYNQLKAIK